MPLAPFQISKMGHKVSPEYPGDAYVDANDFVDQLLLGIYDREKLLGFPIRVSQTIV